MQVRNNPHKPCRSAAAVLTHAGEGSFVLQRSHPEDTLSLPKGELLFG